MRRRNRKATIASVRKSNRQECLKRSLGSGFGVSRNRRECCAVGPPLGALSLGGMPLDNHESALALGRLIWRHLRCGDGPESCGESQQRALGTCGGPGLSDNPYRPASPARRSEASLDGAADGGALGRAIFGGYFLYSGINHFQNADAMEGMPPAKGYPLQGSCDRLGGLSLLWA